MADLNVVSLRVAKHPRRDHLISPATPPFPYRIAFHNSRMHPSITNSHLHIPSPNRRDLHITRAKPKLVLASLKKINLKISFFHFSNHNFANFEIKLRSPQARKNLHLVIENFLPSHRLRTGQSYASPVRHLNSPEHPMKIPCKF